MKGLFLLHPTMFAICVLYTGNKRKEKEKKKRPELQPKKSMQTHWIYHSPLGNALILQNQSKNVVDQDIL